MSDEQTKPDHEVQKMVWTEIAKCEDHADALKCKLAMDQKDKPTKIRRRRNHFSVMQGSPLKKAKKVKEPEEPKKKKPRHHKDTKGKKD